MPALVMSEAERRRAAGDDSFIAGPYSQSLGAALIAGTICRLCGTEDYENDCIAALCRALVAQRLCDRIADFATWLLPEVTP